MKNILLLLLSLTITSCGNDKKSQKVKETIDFDCSGFNKNDENLNISILLDLSDRINPITNPNNSMDFFKRDIGYITSVSESFQCHIANKKSRKINDNIKVFFEPESNIPELNTISTLLNLKFNKDNSTIKKINSVSQIYQKNINDIYNIASQQKEYNGSNIWGFFKNKVNDYIKEDHKNVLVILTDGYLYDKTNKGLKSGKKYANFTSNTIKNFKLNNSNWNATFTKKNIGILPANENLGNLEVIVIGLNVDKKSKNPYELEIMKLLWENWFKDMGITNFAIKTADLPSNLDETIKKFLNK
ncbi:MULTISPECIES: hypothetical protein [Tenacibaculum]|uniref:hypothetical protein n=1 Tax=Tenacibaculum TaxID=104267 RepID=UPI001F0B4D23|nr:MULTISPECIES: hypothetical protein [Tenacibaculum]MCH3883270.1 hypothetical protein [Tenacibaculum aquimarinum]MDO6600374.1 hypothetical protein [Tenacibaculum sp. 1_MG-2023]